MGVLTAQWSQQENLRVSADGILSFEAQTNKDGITYVAFWDMAAEIPEKQGERYSEGSDIAYYLQILDKEGNKLFSDDGQLISHEPSRSFLMGDDRAIFTDSDGNALYIVTDERNQNISGSVDQGYFVYKISPDGQLLWEEPVDLDKGYAYNMVVNIRVVELADGSYVFAHDVYLDGGRSYIVIDRVSKDGEFLWDEPLLLTDNTISYGFPFLVDAGSGDFILVYSKAGTLYAQKFNFDKESLWSAPTTIYRGGFTLYAIYLCIEVISDQKGGCFVGWYDDRNGSKYEKAYVSHIRSNGTQGFVTSNDEEGLRVSYSQYMRAFRPEMCYDPVGGNLYVAFEEHDADQTYRSIVLQKVSKDGELLWSEVEEDPNISGLLLDYGWNPVAADYYTLQWAGDEKVAVFYQKDYSAGGSTENIAVLFDVSGGRPQYVWPNERLVFTEKGKGRAGLISLPLYNNEYFLTFWGDFRTAETLSEPAVFAHKVPLAGYTAVRFPKAGADSRFEIISNRSGNVDFVLDSPAAGNANIEIYSVSGQKIASVRSKLHAGENTIPWNVQHLPAGVYITRLTTPNGVQAKRFIIHN
jgi:hypothetical protein